MQGSTRGVCAAGHVHDVRGGWQVHDAMEQIRKQNGKMLGTTAGGKGGGKAGSGEAKGQTLKPPVKMLACLLL